MSSCENPNADKDVLMTRRQKFDGKTKICVKCKENQGKIVVRYAVYCKTCFFPLVQGRFRKSLEHLINPANSLRRKGLKAAGSLVIGFSGGIGSVTLLDIVAKTYFSTEDYVKETNGKLKGGKDHPRFADKSIWKGKPAVCYVEVCGAFPGADDRTEEIRALVNQHSDQFDFVPLRLEDSFDEKWWDSVAGGDLIASYGLDMSDEDLRLTASSQRDPPRVALRAFLSSLPTQTAVQNAVQTLVRVLLLHTSASRNASHLLLGTSLTSLSVNLISGIAQGAGFSVAEEAQEEWRPSSKNGTSIRVVRPLRDVGMKECAIWNWWCGLDVLRQSRNTQLGSKNSISLLTKDFIFGLESDYPATVSTIARTCAKLTPKEGSKGICCLCERPAQSGVLEWKTRISIRSYQDASSAVSVETRPPRLTEEEILHLTKTSDSLSTPAPSLTSWLCYACHTLLISRSSRGPAASLPLGNAMENISIPLWVRSSILAEKQNKVEAESDVTHGVKLNRADMKKEIAEFLLPDD